MANSKKFLLPSPNFNKNAEGPPTVKPHFLTPSGMTLHARHQPPPMYGKRGATYPGKFLKTNNNSKSTTEASRAVERAETNESQFCEACDMELQSMDDLRRHQAQHEKCPVDSCNYRGHPSVMDKHVTALHSSGLFEKFKKLSTPEEIAAWREERKRKYPTVENTLMRQRAKEQREKRGERLEGNKSRFGKYEDRKRAQNNNYPLKSQGERSNEYKNQKLHRDNMRNKRNNNKRRKKEEHQKLEEKKQNEKIQKIKSLKEPNSNEKTPEYRKDETEMCCDGVYMFRGTSGLSNYEHFKPKKSKETNVLSSLLGMYGSDEDSEEEVSENESNEKDSIKNINISNVESSSNSTEMAKASIDNQIIPKLQEKTYDESFEQKVPNDKEPLNDVNSSFIQLSSKDTAYEKPSNEAEHSNNMSSLAITISTTDTLSDIAEASCNNPETYIGKTDENLENETSEKFIEDDKFEEYKEMDCSDDEPPEEAPIARSTDLPIPSKHTQATVATNTAKSTSSDLPPTERSKMDHLSRLKKQKYGLDYRKARLRKQNTLLEKLLEPDIRHERNVLLQCVRYVCENKFFGIGEKKKD